MWLWDSRTHQFIVSVALNKCSSKFRNFIHLYQEYFIFGIEAPDRIYRDFTNHYYNCTPNNQNYHSGKIVDKIVSKIHSLKALKQEPQMIVISKEVPPFIASLLNTPTKNFVYELGVLLHYLSDLHQPFHTDGKYRFDDEETIHKIMEADVRKHLSDFSFDLKRRKRILDYHDFFMDKIFEINEFYDDLVNFYYKSIGKVKRDRWENSFQIIQTCLNEGIQNCANIMLEFENITTIYKNEIKREKLLQKIQLQVNAQKKYSFRKYPTGSISLKCRK